MPPVFGSRTGYIALDDYDKSVIIGLGGQYDRDKNEWYLLISPLYKDMVGAPREVTKARVMYKRPEPTQLEFDLPLIAIRRDDIQVDTKRIFQLATEYRIPAEGATPVSVNGEIGYTQYETKEQEAPYNLIYTIDCWARYRHVAQMMLQMIMTAYPLRGVLRVTDSIGNIRTYLTEQASFQDLTEINSMVDRICGYSVTMKVEATLTLGSVAKVIDAFTGERGPLTPGGDPPFGGPINPDLPPGGLYGDGYVTTRVTFKESP